MTPLPMSTSHLPHVYVISIFTVYLYVLFHLLDITHREENWWGSSSKLMLWKGDASVVYNNFYLEVSNLEVTQEEWLDRWRLTENYYGDTFMFCMYVYNYSISWLNSIISCLQYCIGMETFQPILGWQLSLQCIVLTCWEQYYKLYFFYLAIHLGY